MSKQKKEIEARDSEAKQYEQRYLLSKGYLFDWVEKMTVLNALNLQEEDVVLDIGCGTGRLSLEIAQRCRKVYGLDFSTESIAVLNKKINEKGITNIKTFVGDVSELLPIKEKIDKIVSVQVIQHIPTFNGKKIALKNMYQCLRPGGECIVTVYRDKPTLNKEGWFLNGIYYFRFTPSEIASLFKKAHFKDISVRGCINFSKYHLLNCCKIYKLFYPLALFDIFLSKLKISSSTGQYLICKGFK